MYAIVCMNELQGIGYRGMIPWKSKEDMRFFRRVTIGDGNNAVVMGHNTFKSIGSRPLSNRKNYVLTRTLPCTETHPYENDSVVYLTNIENVLLLSHLYDKVFIIGGEEIYKIFEPHYQKIYVTHIHNHIPCPNYGPSAQHTYHKAFAHSPNEIPQPFPSLGEYRGTLRGYRGISPMVSPRI